MDVFFIGYADFNFDTKDGSHIEGVKFYYMYPSSQPNYYGNEVGDIFVPASRADLCDAVRHCVPGNAYRLNMGFNGKKAIFNGISPIKAS